MTKIALIPLVAGLLAAAIDNAAAENRLPPETRQELIHSHNTWRNTVGVPPLDWAEDLAASAQQWANRLAAERACEMEHSPAELRQKAGENLYWAGPVIWTNGKTEVQVVSGTKIVESWSDERADYDHARNECRKDSVCGHYTQVVWHSSREVGCAVQQCADKSQIWVCRYRPAGNWIGQRPY